MFKLPNNLKNEFKVVVSTNKNYLNYSIVSSYGTLQEAKNNMDQDIAKYRMKNFEMWKRCYPKYHAVIRVS